MKGTSASRKIPPHLSRLNPRNDLDLSGSAHLTLRELFVNQRESNEQQHELHVMEQQLEFILP